MSRESAYVKITREMIHWSSKASREKETDRRYKIVNIRDIWIGKEFVQFQKSARSNKVVAQLALWLWLGQKWSQIKAREP